MRSDGFPPCYGRQGLLSTAFRLAKPIRALTSIWIICTEWNQFGKLAS